MKNAQRRDYGTLRGWCFQRQDGARVKLFTIDPCPHCKAEFSQPRYTLNEPSDQALIDSGLRQLNPPALQGGAVFAGGPAFCSLCALAWRQGKIR